MYRTHTCGELRITNAGQTVTLAGWVQRTRKLGGMTFVDLRDRYGITQLVVDASASADLIETAGSLGREFVIQATGEVIERQSKNPKMPTGDIEIRLSSINILNKAQTPPFTIEDVSDGGEELRAKYRYLDLRRNPLKKALELRHRLAHEVRNYLDSKGFLEIETPYLIKSTPEGARDFVVPSRMNPGQFYALPQSPQTFKQLLMVAGYDRYFQIVRCFRDEDLRADRQPEFTQIDCEMSFVERDDVLDMFEGMMRTMFKNVLNVDIPDPLPRMSWFDAMDYYGSDKPDIRFGMKIHEITSDVQGHGFSVFDSVEYVGAICVPGLASYTRKQLDELTEWVKRPQVGAKGMVYIKINEDGSIKSSVDKFYTPEQLQAIAAKMEANRGDLILVLCGQKRKTQTMLGVLRIEMGNRLGLRDPHTFAPLWTRHSVSMRCTILSPLQSRNISTCSTVTGKRILRKSVQMHTTSYSTVPNSEEAPSGFTTPRYSRGCSKSSVSPMRMPNTSSASSSMPSSSGLRLTEALHSASTGCAHCSAVRRPSGTISHSLRTTRDVT